MTTLTAERGALASVLTEAEGLSFTIHPYMPARLQAPGGLIVPGSPYLESGNTFGSFKIRLEAHLAVRTANNEVATEELDAALDIAVVAVVNAGWGVESVSEPYGLEANGATYLAAAIQVTRAIRL